MRSIALNGRRRRARRLLYGLALLASCAALPVAAAPRYVVGSPTLTDVWVDPVNGSDANGGATRAQALRTVTAAWNLVPVGATLATTGYRIQLLPGTFPEASVPHFWESRWGTYRFPVILQAADGPATVRLPPLNVFDCRYFYLIDLELESGGGDVLHLDTCDHVLLRRLTVRGTGDIQAGNSPQETLKVNQSQYVYVEDSDISGAWDNAVDFVGVQYGHVVGNRIHHSVDWCIYLKGGSAYFRIEGNEIFDGGTGGFTAGQGTGFQFMVSPWLHYEAYDIKFVNNVVHDTQGAGMGVNGGYNVLLAHNTLYRIGSRSHILELGFGSRSCDGMPGDAGRERCGAYRTAGGWGTTVVDDGTNYVRIPNRNVYVYNNVFYNPAGFQSADQHFSIFGPYSGDSQAGSNVAVPTLSDSNARIRGNLIWNGPASHPLGIEDASAGCQPSNPACNASQLRADNAINTIEPQMVDPAGGNYRPVAGGTVFGAATFEIPSFAGGDRPSPPAVPEGLLDNGVPVDRDGLARTSSSPPGAYAGSSAPAASLELTLGKSAYATGDTITVEQFRIRNPGATATPARLRLWLKVPAVGEVTLIDVGTDGSFALPANLDVDVAPLPLFTVSSGFPPRGSWELDARVSSPTTGATLAEDVNPFTVQ